MASTKKAVRYKQPRSFNVVSATLLLLLCGALYWGYCFGPAYLKYLLVKQHAKEAASRYYKLSPLEKSLRAQEVNKMLTETRGKIIQTLGFNPPRLTVQLLINEQSKKVNVVADYEHVVHLVGTDRQRVLHFKALGESDYNPVDW